MLEESRTFEAHRFPLISLKSKKRIFAYMSLRRALNGMARNIRLESDTNLLMYPQIWDKIRNEPELLGGCC